MKRLAAEGIHVVAVAGNHDWDVLPRLAPSLGRSFHLFGAGGTWQAMNVPVQGGTGLRIVGWSSPAERVAASPLSTMPALPEDDVPVLGLLHGDLDAPRSPYAPLSAPELRSTRVSFWLLGHLHAGRLDAPPGAAPLLYPGSPQALDPGETGPHGAWILEMAAGRAPRARFIPLSSVRYDAVDVDVTGVSKPEALDRQVVEAVRAHLQTVVEAGCGPLRHLSCRVRLTGRTPLHHAIESRLGGRLGELDAEHGEVRARIEGLLVHTRPEADLAALAATADAPGVLARFVLALDADRFDGAEERLLTELACRATDVRRTRAYHPLGEPDASPAALREIARGQALLLLDELLSQKEAA